MSRHRFVKNLDLDAEMEEEDEEEEGMTAEQKAQMATSVPIARALLKDVKPPISDNAIADSLWHYWFDVDKAVTYLRRDWEKKGEADPPPELVPTPEQQPRRRTVKRQRLETPDQVPLSALQRLSLSRQSPAKPTSSGQGTPGRSSSGVDSPGLSGGDAAKPKSKLAMLAEQRRLAAAAKQASDTPSSAAPSSPLPSTDASAGESASPAKPLSKLAQKMAAARAAKASSAATASTNSPSPNPAVNSIGEAHEDVDMVDDIDYTLFPRDANTPAHPTSTHPSTFFSVLTTTHRKALSPPTNLSMHLPAIGDPDELEKRVRSAFGEGVESPDDIVLRARSGRAGTAALAQAQTIDSKT